MEAHIEPLTVQKAVRQRLARLGGRELVRCCQCATCAAVCELSDHDVAFPRRQMLYAQLGAVDKLQNDPAIWLCHQCNDCSAHCPRGANPGDGMAAARALVIFENAGKGVVASLFEKIKIWWPLVVGVPIAIWFGLIGMLWGIDGFMRAPGAFRFDELVPHWLIYCVHIPLLLAIIGFFVTRAKVVWQRWEPPRAAFAEWLRAMGMTLVEVVLHRRMNICTTAKSRSTGHFLVMWGLIGALLTTSAVAVATLFFAVTLPFPLVHPFKLLGNVAGVMMIAGSVWLLQRRIRNVGKTENSIAFDYFLPALILAVAITGLGAEGFRLLGQPAFALPVYLIHLGLVGTFIGSLPFSKLGHLVYRLMAVVRFHLKPDTK